MKSFYNPFLWLAFVCCPSLSIASTGSLNQTNNTLAYIAVGIFVIGYALVIAEEFIHLRKSKPMLLAAGIIWVLVALLSKNVEGGAELLDSAVSHNLLEYAALLLFLLTAMIISFIN